MKLVLLLLSLLVCARAQAQDMSSFNRYEPGQNPVLLNYDTWQLSEREGGAYLGLEQGSIRVPILTTLTQGASLYVKGSRLRMANPVIIQDRGFSVPQELGNLDLGLSWGNSLEGGDAWNANFSYGASGSRLLDRQDQREMTATGIYRTREVEGGSWLFLLSYSNNRTILNKVPLPGFAYSYKRGRELQLIAGLPFLFVYWSPDPKFSAVSFATLNGAGVEFASFVKMPVQLYAGWNINARVFLNTVSEPFGSGNDRLFYDTREVAAGVRVVLGRDTRASLGYSYVYQRNFFISNSLWNPDKVLESVPSAGGLTLKLAAGF